MNNMATNRLIAFLTMCLMAGTTARAQTDITTWQVNTQHTGANLQETILTPAAVSATGNFGLLFTQPLDGQTYGQPLFVSSGTLGRFADGSLHNVVYVATQHDSVYAFDGDSGVGTNSAPLWHTSLLPPGTIPVPAADTLSGDIQVEVGITTTPVIDPVASTLFVVSKVKTTSNNTYQQYLHALDLKTGADKVSPVLINPTFAGTTTDAVNGVIPFNPLREHARPAMMLYQGVVYISYASHGDNGPYHGEILGYNTSNLQLVRSFISTPNGQDGGFWMSGAGPTVDASGNMFIVSGNGPYDQTASQGAAGNDWGNAMLKLPLNTTGAITLPIAGTSNYYLPPNWLQLQNGDNDIGSGGLLLLPDQAGPHPHLMMGGSKQNIFYLLDRDNLGGSSATDMAVQEIQGANSSHEILVTPAYFNQNIYYAVAGEPLTQRAVGFDTTTGHYISTNPILSTNTYSGSGRSVFITATPQNTNGLVWILTGNGLDVYNAANVSGQPIYSQSATIPSPNGNIGCQNTKFSLPIAVNGKAYYTASDNTNTGHLFVSGLKPVATGIPAAPSNLNVVATSSSSITLTWTSNSNNETGFQISRSSSGSGLAPYRTTGAGVTSFSDTGLSANTQYSYQVQAVNASGSSSGTAIQSATTFGSTGDVNLAYLQPATASSSLGGNTPDKAFDANVTGTRWESVQGVDPQWIQVDLGTVSTIHSIQLNWENAAGANYSFSTSPNGIDTFTPLGNPVVGNTSGGIKTYTGLNGTGRFVRMTGTTRTTQYGYSLWDFEVIGVPGSSSGGSTTAPSITSASSASGTVGAGFTYTITASQSPTSYGVTGTLPAGLTLNTATGAITGTPTAAGSSSVTISATNGVGMGNATLTFTIGATLPAGTAVYQIAAGGGAASPFVADEFFSQSATANTNASIAIAAGDAAPLAVYQSERYGGSFTYTLPGLTAGKNYTVILHFAEIYFSSTQQRVFNVAINGTTVLPNFDIVAVANGPKIAVVRSFTATPINNQIVISFTTGTANLPKVSGIELIAN